MLEMGTRDRIMGDCTKVMPNEIYSSAKKKALNKLNSNDLILEALEAESDMDHPVSVKSFKHKKQFKPKISSTCPSLPRIHYAFDCAAEYTTLTQDHDRKSLEETPNEMAKRLQNRMDKREFNEDFTDVEIVDDIGITIMYDVVLNDIIDMEDELIKVGTFYIKKQEFVMDSELKEPEPSIDRSEVCMNLLMFETQFQFAKMKLVELYIEVYDHTCDIVEQQRLIQTIVDLMSRRPRMNSQSTYFIDSYKAEIDCLEKRTDLLREVIDMQMRTENAASKDVENHLEGKYRMINDHANKKW